jgi:hypothetical protein
MVERSNALWSLGDLFSGYLDREIDGSNPPRGKRSETEEQKKTEE